MAIELDFMLADLPFKSKLYNELKKIDDKLFEILKNDTNERKRSDRENALEHQS